MPATPQQPSLFRLPPPVVEAAPLKPDEQLLAERLPPELRLGGMSWSYPGWRGVVYSTTADTKLLAAAGLTAYGKHPLLRAVEIDRSFYEPLPAQYFNELSQQVPADFRFLVKAHEDCTLFSYPRRPRFGKKQGEPNRRYLDAGYAASAVVASTVEGLGKKLGALLFQFPPQDESEPQAFADKLYQFLHALPRGVPYAVELRTPQLLTPAYAAALEASGAVHTHNVWGNMPPVLQQARLLPPVARKPLLVRWMMRRGEKYADAGSRFSPFSRLVEPDQVNRAQIASLMAKALAHAVPAFAFINNKAEGCAPASAAELARSILAAGAGASGPPTGRVR
jgi:uncharacterized protein YecE (DUF72 family)